jgi:hypothetical protein
MLRVGLLMATRAPIMPHVVRSGAGVDRPLLTVRQDVKQPLDVVMEEGIQLPRYRPLKTQLRLQQHPLLHPQQAAPQLGTSQGQKSAPYPTGVSFTIV